MTTFILFLTTLIVSLSNARFVIDSFTNEGCYLPPELKREIRSYRNVTRRIMEEIIVNGLGDRMYHEYTTFIDKFGPRPAGTNVLENSINYMINLTKTFGLQDIATEDVEIPYWKRGYESATMLLPRKQNIALLGLGSSISTPAEGITAGVIVVRNFEELDKLDINKVKGKIVVYNAVYKSYGETVIYRSDGASKAALKGAVASLVRSITPFSIYSPHTGAQFYKENVTKIPTAAITIEDADLLHRLQENSENIVINLKMLNTFNTSKSRNTLVDLKGSQKADKMVIVSGHIDSWDVGQGAMDDGGGMMISWFVPVVLNQLNLRAKRTVRAILWTSEEPGLIGAAAYLQKHIDELSDIDFIMESDEGTFEPLGLTVDGSKNAVCIIAEILKLTSPIDRVTSVKNPGSDINLILNEGVPGASLMNKNDKYFWYHHSSGDTLTVQNKTNVIQCAAFWTAVSYVIADMSSDIPRT